MARDQILEFWIDRGGTFTDVIAVRPDGHLRALKLLSENPEHYADAAVEGIRRILGLNSDEPIPTELIRSVKMGTTVATNALLERKGEPTVLVVNKNLRDVLRIGTQQRPHLFDLEIKLPRPIYDHVIEIPGRSRSKGASWSRSMSDKPRSFCGMHFQTGSEGWPLRLCTVSGFLNTSRA